MSDFLDEKSLTKLEILKHNIQKISLISKVSTIIIVFLVLITFFISKETFMNDDGIFHFKLHHTYY